jgi:hypothetical protein
MMKNGSALSADGYPQIELRERQLSRHISVLTPMRSPTAACRCPVRINWVCLIGCYGVVAMFAKGTEHSVTTGRFREAKLH